MEKDNIMKYETILPQDFTGVFNFTNWSDKEFVGVWSRKEYHYPALASSPMIIPEHSPLEIQYIRKKFAKDLAEREFFKSTQYERIRGQEGEKLNGVVIPRLNSIQQAGTYTLSDLTEGIQKCLKPLEIKKAFIENVQSVPIEDKLSKNDEGELNTMAIKGSQSLKERALAGKGLPTE